MNTLVRSFAACALALVFGCNSQAPSAASDETQTQLEQQLIAECRQTTRECLKGAVTVTDISSCRGIFKSCVGDGLGLVSDTLTEAIEIADEAIDITIDQATGLIDDVGGLTTHALSAVEECHAGATACLKGVVSVSDISKCQEVFDACVGSAMNLVGVGIDIDLPGGATKPGQCSLGVSACLGKGKPPADCAADAQICLFR